MHGGRNYGLLGVALFSSVMTMTGILYLAFQGDDGPSASPRKRTTSIAQERTTQSNLRNALTAEKVFFTDNFGYTEIPRLLSEIEPTLDYAQGIAESASEPNVVYLKVTGSENEVVCVSSKSRSGELFLIKDVAQGFDAATTYARGASLPRRCDSTPLEERW